MFNVLPRTEISVHAEFSHCRQNWYDSSMTLKVGSVTVRVHLDPHCQKVKGQDPRTPTYGIAVTACGKLVTKVFGSVILRDDLSIMWTDFQILGLKGVKYENSSSGPPKGTSLRENASFDRSWKMKIGQPWRPVGEVKKRKERKQKEMKVTNSDISRMRRDHPRRPIATIFGS